MIRGYRNYLGGKIVDENGNSVRRLEYLKDHRIELNTILDAAGPEAFWKWLRWKILKTWPYRNYFYRAINLEQYLYSSTLVNFLNWYEDKSKSIIKDHRDSENANLLSVEGLINDVDKKKQEIEHDILNNTLLQNEQIKKLDKALEKIMNDDRFNK